MQISLNGVLRVCVVWRPLAKHPRDQFVSPQIVHSLTGESPCQLIKASTPALGSPGPLFQFLKGVYGHHTYIQCEQQYIINVNKELYAKGVGPVAQEAITCLARIVQRYKPGTRNDGK